jgi:transcriptional regulator with XRE-family HTH domain
VKQRRVLLGITQVGLAKAVGYTHGWVSSLEKGEGNPPAEALTALAVALGEKPEDYLALAGKAVLRAENVVPATRTITLTERELQAMLTRAAEAAVRNVLAERLGPTE